MSIDARHYEIGTVTDGAFDAGSFGSDESLLTFDTLGQAVQEICYAIAQVRMFGHEIHNGAIREVETGTIIWRQVSDKS